MTIFKYDYIIFLSKQEIKQAVSKKAQKKINKKALYKVISVEWQIKQNDRKKYKI